MYWMEEEETKETTTTAGWWVGATAAASVKGRRGRGEERDDVSSQVRASNATSQRRCRRPWNSSRPGPFATTSGKRRLVMMHAVVSPCRHALLFFTANVMQCNA